LVQTFCANSTWTSRPRWQTITGPTEGAYMFLVKEFVMTADLSSRSFNLSITSALYLLPRGVNEHHTTAGLSRQLWQEQLQLTMNDWPAEVGCAMHSASCSAVRYCKGFGLHVGFEVLTAVVTNVEIFWDIAPCSPYVNRSFGGTHRRSLQSRKSDKQ
jgi:hypothetical protein